MNDPLLAVEAVSKCYLPRGLPRHRARDSAPTALQEVSFRLVQGRLLGLVGASGSGKTTLARCLALVEPPDSGRVLLEGHDLWSTGRRERAGLRARIQLIAQQPAASLNPRFAAAAIVAEPLAIQRRGTAAERRRTAARWMERVGLATDALDKRALEFSGGERQRLAIARALILEPSLLILDESFAGLDLSVQGQIARLLRELCKSGSLSAILITHDLALAASLAGEIAVMDAGRIVECGPTADLIAHPRHACTRQLLAAARALTLEEPA
ncbi:MAG TPA: dipeptide/oligopeptide/nickel ABC transporter ATP-binding protein [Bryobacteraceae bacterium]|nr:dipeptide/oligopeptide/nickel ABC transporter ATP-binding protein [Bryobacteraceae bacterium]